MHSVEWDHKTEGGALHCALRPLISASAPASPATSTR